MKDEYIVNLLGDGTVTRAFTYIGGKSRYIDWLYSHFPTNFSSFYDVCGGSGSVTFSLNVPEFCSKVVLNDYDKTIHNFYATLKGERGKELENRLLNFDYDNLNKLEWHGRVSTIGYIDGMDKVEAAFNTYLQIVFSYSNMRKDFIKKNPGYLKKVTQENIPRVRERLQKIEVTKRDFIDILKELRDKEEKSAFVYIDVPYRMVTRGDRILYNLELDERKHDEMLKILKDGVPFRWALSGYREEELFKTDKYDVMLSKYSKYTKVLPTYKFAGANKKKETLFKTPADDLIDKFVEKANKQLGKSEAVNGKTPVKEILWRNYEVLGEPEI